MKVLAILLAALVLAGCTDAIRMKNPQTGQIVECGPYYTGLAPDFKLKGIAMREHQCISDYQAQGFVRVPNGDGRG